MKQIDILPGANERLSEDSPHPPLLKSLAFTRDIKTNTKMIYETKNSCDAWSDLKL